MTLVGLAACLDSTAPKSGEMSLAMPASPGILDSGHVVLSGPTAKTVTVAPGATVTISGLVPGTYTVGLVGFYGGGAAFSAQVSGVSVVAGQNTTPALPALVASFGVTVSPGTGSIAPGATQQFTAVAKDAQGNTISPITFFWASSNQNVALVDQTGLATGVAGGTVTISALGLGVPGNAALTVQITPGTPVKLGFIVPPAGGDPNLPLAPAVQVAIQDQFGNTVPSANNPVTVGLGTNPAAATLSGTPIVVPVNGVATFDSLVINKTGDGYTLQATTTAGLTAATSASFDIFLDFVSISAGGSVGDPFPGLLQTHTCGLTARGAAYCWGNGTNGQLGNASNTSSNVPVLVFGGNKFISIAAGLNHTCGVRADSAALCWGDNANRQLGNGTTNPSNVPVPVSGTDKFTSVSAGHFHTCALRSDKAAMCWGDHSVGQLGYNATTGGFSATPVVVAGNHSFVALDAGRDHTCGIDTGGAAYCWGWDGNGQLGDGGGFTNSGVPAVVFGGHTFSSISAGAFHTCGVRATDRRALCWGHNGQGQSGSGLGDQVAPVLVVGGLTFASVDVGSRHSCGVTTSGAAACWGLNNYSQLGNGGGPDQGAPVLVAGGLTFSAVNAGEAQTCALSASGAYCWGRNDLGQLGNGTNVLYALPIRVAGSR